MKKIRIALCQINPTVGDISGNGEKIKDFIEKAKSYDADIAVFPAFSLTGWPLFDLLLEKGFIEKVRVALYDVASLTEDIVALLGWIEEEKGCIYNSCAVCGNRGVLYTYRQSNGLRGPLFKYFSSGKETGLFNFEGINFSPLLCEEKRESLLAPLLFHLSATPYVFGHNLHDSLKRKAKEYGVFYGFVNLVGAQDGWVFEGKSAVFDKEGKVLVEAKQFQEDIVFCDLQLEDLSEKGLFVPFKIKERKREIEKRTNISFGPLEEVYNALVLGTRDYVVKNGFQKVILGLSGGIDSALVATIATDALGRENVLALFMPSQFTSKESREDVYILAQRLGIKILEIPIDGLLKAYTELLKSFTPFLPEITEENLQPRIRANLLMAFANTFCLLVLSTGNKSETSTGYCTLYGDTAGAIAVIGDLPKTMVYKIAEWRNKKTQVIPERILKKIPSAELKPDQMDTEKLPPYEILDPILDEYLKGASLKMLLERGFEEETLKRVFDMIRKSEYKRRQSPPSIRISETSFGRDRIYPITNRFEE